MSESELREQIANIIWGREARGTNSEGYKDIVNLDKEPALQFADQILALIKDAGYLQVEPVQLEVLGDEEISTIWHEYNENQSWHGQLRRIRKVSQATIAHNEAKGQLFRRK